MEKQETVSLEIKHALKRLEIKKLILKDYLFEKEK